MSPAGWLLRALLWIVLGVTVIAFGDSTWKWLVKWTTEAKKRSQEEQ